MQYLIAFYSRLDAAGDVISGRFLEQFILEKFPKFRDPCLNRSGEIQPRAVGCGIFGRFSNFDNCRPEVVGDVVQL